MMSRKILLVAAAAAVLSSCGNSPEATADTPATPTPTPAVLTADERAAIDAMEGDFQALSRNMRSASMPTAQREYATTQFIAALATATTDDLDTLLQIVDYIPPTSPAKEATQARIQELQGS